MGLDCSHEAFHGAYSWFNRLRQCICRAVGPNSSFPPHWQYNEDGTLKKDHKGLVMYNHDLDPDFYYIESGYQDTHPGLKEFLSHSDCDGEISPEMCLLVANDLEELLPAIEELGWVDMDYLEYTRRFIIGCRLAHKNGEPLTFQ